MELLVNDTVLFSGTEKECIKELHIMVLKALDKEDVSILEVNLMSAEVNHTRFGRCRWHIEFELSGGVFKNESDNLY
jgi:hypothetical protein